MNGLHDKPFFGRMRDIDVLLERVSALSPVPVSTKTGRGHPPAWNHRLAAREISQNIRGPGKQIPGRSMRKGLCERKSSPPRHSPDGGGGILTRLFRLAGAFRGGFVAARADPLLDFATTLFAGRATAFLAHIFPLFLIL